MNVSRMRQDATSALEALLLDERLRCQPDPSGFLIGDHVAGMLGLEALEWPDPAKPTGGLIETVWGIPVRACSKADPQRIGVTLRDGTCPFCGLDLAVHKKVRVPDLEAMDMVRRVDVIDPEHWARISPGRSFNAFITNRRLYRFTVPSGPFLFLAVSNSDRRQYEPDRSGLVVAAILYHLEDRGFDPLEVQFDNWSDHASVFA